MATVSGLVDAGGRVGHLLEVELRNVGASNAGTDDVGPELPDRGAEQRNVDNRRLSGALPFEQRPGDPRRDRQAAVDVAERGPLDRRVGVVRGVPLTDPPARPVGREIESTLVGKIALGPIAVSTRVDDLRITGTDLLDVDAHPPSRIR